MDHSARILDILIILSKSNLNRYLGSNRSGKKPTLNPGNGLSCNEELLEDDKIKADPAPAAKATYKSEQGSMHHINYIEKIDGRFEFVKWFILNDEKSQHIQFYAILSREDDIIVVVAQLKIGNLIRCQKTTTTLQDKRIDRSDAYQDYHILLREYKAIVGTTENRKNFWVELDVKNRKSHAHLREVLAPKLINGIYQRGNKKSPRSFLRTSILPNHTDALVAVISSWNFSAHKFTDDELLSVALLIFQHTLAMPELESWRLSTESLMRFLMACRSAYNSSIPYHNFRHAVDVLQACFIFLIKIGKIPPFPDANIKLSSYQSTITKPVRSCDALTLLIAAIGHDVSHPGVSNAFLIALNAPLAQRYNDRSVLESFHCDAYSRILRCYWPSLFRSGELKNLIISSILATDMGLHFDYLNKLVQITENNFLLENSIGQLEPWSSRDLRKIACSLLIKCADISNVARKYDISSTWTLILTDEFVRQANIEKDIGIPSVLYRSPVYEIIALGESQISFIDTFAFPLFDEVTKAIPAMSFCVEELRRNKGIWVEKMTQKKKQK